jgi:bifunctional non-homologous end joining protein LigD
MPSRERRTARSRKGHDLATYDAKRDFENTPEPSGRRTPSGKARKDSTGAPAAASHGIFVVQKHAARSLHYDFRLEHDGVLLSWAVPKGPSLDPRQRRLAVQVEDHPVDYASFEGVIPEGNYGAGKVEIWDRGRWMPHGDVGRSLRKGHLDFRLIGGKLAGDWHLVRLTDRPGAKPSRQPNWLLFRAKGEGGEAAASAAPEKPAKSSKRRFPARAAQPVGESSGAAAELFELATLVEQAPEGADWIHETKWDGYRLLAAREGKGVRLWSRSGADWTERLPEIAEAVSQLAMDDGILDGELVALSGGRSDFQSLQAALGETGGSRGRRNLRYQAFDLLTLDGEDLRSLPLVERKRRLAELLEGLPAASRIRFSAHQKGRGPERLRTACARGLEGILSKRADAPYRAGRGRDWLKVKCHQRQELVIVGYTTQSAHQEELAALLLAVGDGGNAFTYAGRVGTGFDQKTRTALMRRLRGLAAGRPELSGAVPGEGAVRWVRPELVAEVQFAEWTSDGRLRHPSFLGLREDKAARDVRRETPAGRAGTPARQRVVEQPDPAVVKGVRISHPDRLLFPEAKLTKLDLARYFAAVWRHIEPHLRDRPLAFLRCPEGARAACFFQKHWGAALAGVVPVDVSAPGKSEPDQARIGSVAGLVGLAQFGVIELHLWGARAKRLERPDRVVFDLDPGPRVAWNQVVTGARLLRSLLAELGLESFAMLSGGKGVHVVVPIRPEHDWATVKGFAAAIAQGLATASPARYVDHASKSARSGRIFVDYLRNGRGATAIAPFSPRARARGSVATPISWEELARSTPDRWTIESIPKRLLALESDPWKGYFELDQSLSRSALAALGVESPAEEPLSRRTGMATRKTAKKAARKSVKRKSAKSSGPKRYGEKAAEKVERAMHEMKEGKLRSGGSGKKVTSRKQAIAIGLSEARAAGGKVPKAPARKSAKRKK